MPSKSCQKRRSFACRLRQERVGQPKNFRIADLLIETMYDLHVEKKQHELEIVEGVQVRLSQRRYSHPRQQRHIPGKVGEE